MTSMTVTEQGGQALGVEPADVDEALRALVLAPNATVAAARLREQGMKISAQKLRRWRDTSFRTRYYELRSELRDQVGEELAGRAMERAIQADEAEAEYIDRAVSLIADASPSDVSGMIRALVASKDVNISKGQLLRSKPTEIKETRDVGALLRILERHGIKLEGGPDLAGLAKEILSE